MHLEIIRKHSRTDGVERVEDRLALPAYRKKKPR
jgi:hypothetical protein